MSFTKSMSKANYSPVSEFVFLGLSTSRPVQHFLLAFSTVFYVIIVLGNFLVVFTVTFDPHLHSPMYFLLANLSSIDLCFSTLTVPKMISDLYSGHKTISFQGCVTQIFVLHTLVDLRWCCSLPWPLTAMWPYVSPCTTWPSWAHGCAFCFCVVLGLLASFTQWSS